MAAFIQAGMTAHGPLFAAHDIDDEPQDDIVAWPGLAMPAGTRLQQEWSDAFAVWCEQDGLRRAIETAIAVSAAARWPDQHAPGQP